MTDEVLINRLYDVVDEITRIGGEQERTSITPGILVADANPNDLPTGYIKIVNPRDGGYVPCLTVNGLVVSDNDLVNVLFTKGTEPIALSQSSNSPSNTLKVSEVWESDFGAVALQADADGGIGISTSTIPHGGIGAAKFAIDGANSSADGPHIQITTDSDDYPLVQLYNAAHDEIYHSFDAYSDGTNWRSSDAGSNAQIKKATDRLQIMYDNGIAQGSVVTWDDLLTLNLLNGRVGVLEVTPQRQLHLTPGAGALPALPTGDGIVIQHNGATNDNARLTLIAGATTGGSYVDFGDSANATVGQIRYDHLTNQMRFSANGGEKVFIDSSGNLGVNTSGPDAKLDVLDTTGAQLRLTHTDGSKFVDFTLDTNHDLTITPSSTGQIVLQPTTDSADFFQVLDADGGNPILNVDSTNERVGIGTSNPSWLLNIVRTNDQALFAIEREGLYSGSDFVGQFFFVYDGDTLANIVCQRDGADDTADLALFTQSAGSNTEKMRIKSGGNVGIGTTSPAAQLHVDQSSTTAAQPVAYFDQADVSEEMFQFETTIGTGNAIEAIGAKTLTTTHFIKVTLPGGLTRYFPVGTIA